MKEVICLDCGAVFSTAGVYARRCKVCAKARRMRIDRENKAIKRQNKDILDRKLLAGKESHADNMGWIAAIEREARKHGMHYGQFVAGYNSKGRQ